MTQRIVIGNGSHVSNIFQSSQEGETRIGELIAPENEVVTSFSLHNGVTKIVCESGKEYVRLVDASNWLEVPQEVEVPNSVFYRKHKVRVSNTHDKGN